MHKLKSWKIISEKGDFIKNEWKKIADKYKLEIIITGLRPMISFKFNYEEHNILKTFITQEMLIYGFLASNTIYVSIAHSDEIIKKYLYFLEKTFFKISKFENFNDIAKKLISKQPSQSTFKRLN
jgi:glutamate-1-semialdehyde 2,1-aminomutase